MSDEKKVFFKFILFFFHKNSERSILLEYEKLEQKEAKILSLFAVSYLRSTVICPLRETIRMNESQFELSCGNSSFHLPITVDLKDFRKFLQDGKNCPYSSLCCGLRSSMVFSYKNEFRLHVLCQQCLEVTVYCLARSFRGKSRQKHEQFSLI